MRNILGLIRGLITQGRDRAGTLEEFASVIGGRIQALARAHDQITIDNWGPASLRTLFAAETAAYLNAKADRVSLEGPDVLLDPRAFSTLALVVHELLTDPAKYGALADSVGKVRGALGAYAARSAQDRLDGRRRTAGARANAARLRHARRGLAHSRASREP